VQEFLDIVHHLQGDQLDAWIAKVTASQIKELQRFAKGLERDKAAVLTGLSLSYNNGQTEGQVTRIKLIKRMMYGRAGFARLASTRLTPLLGVPTLLPQYPSS
jgi:transposase